MGNYENLKNYLLSNGELRSIVSEINSIDGSLDYLEYWENDESFFNTYFYNSPMEVARSVFYGDYRYCDDYVAFDSRGNLESFNDWELEKEYKEYIDEIVNALIEHHEEIDISEDLNELIEKYIEEVNK